MTALVSMQQVVKRYGDVCALQVEELGFAMAGQSSSLAPADRKLYALRDATSTVSSVELICASILGKKLAEGLDTLVLDVKCGSGAFMKTPDSARKLGEKLIAVARQLGCSTSALLTRMSIPLGLAVGNSLEIVESLQLLRGGGPTEVRELVIRLTAMMVSASDSSLTADAAASLCRERLGCGEALSLFERMVVAQGGDLDAFETSVRTTRGGERLEVRSPRSGFFAGMDALTVGETVRGMGGGRYRTDDIIDHSVGWEQLAPPGRDVAAGELLGIVHAGSAESAVKAESALRDAMIWDSPVDDLVLGEL